MTALLAFDTTSAYGSIALVDGDGIREQVTLYSSEGFSQTIFQHISALLQRHTLRVDEVHAFAVSSGPGSFTGVRVGLAAAKGLAEACRKPAFAVSHLLSLASLGTATVRAVVMDARRGEVFGAVYDDSLRTLSAEAVLPLRDWLASLPPGTAELVTPDATPFRAHLPAAITVNEQRFVAGAVGLLAWNRLHRGESGDPAGLDANYVRRSDAEMNWTDGPR